MINLLRNGKLHKEKCISELGIFSAVMYDTEMKTSTNKDGVFPFIQEIIGNVLRTKPANSAEGGICNGDGVVDTPIFVSDEHYLKGTELVKLTNLDRLEPKLGLM